MFVLERLLGVVTYASLLLFFCIGIASSRGRSVRRWLIAYAIVLGVLGFLYVPTASADLSRLLIYMHEWSKMDVPHLIAYCGESATPAYVAYFWLVGQLGHDGFLPGITASLFYLLTFSCYWDFAQRKKIAPPFVALGVALFMSLGSFLQVISTIRSYLAFALVFRATYTEWEMERPIVANIPYYVVALTLHPAAVLLVFVRVAFLVVQKRSTNLQRVGSFVACSSLFIIALTFGEPYVNAMFGKAEIYLTSDTYSYYWETLLHGIVVVFGVYTLRHLRIAEHGSHALTSSNIKRFAILLTGFVIFAFPLEYAVFVRFSTMLAAYIVFFAMLLLQEKRPNYSSAVLLVSLLMLLIACMRGDLSGYKFLLL